MASPPKLTPALQNAIVNAVSIGVPLRMASELAGVAFDTVLEWIQRGEGRHPTRRATAPYVQFAHALKKAEAQDQARRVARIEQAARGGQVLVEKTSTTVKPDGSTVTVREVKYSAPSWVADAWHLERTDPKHWAIASAWTCIATGRRSSVGPASSARNTTWISRSSSTVPSATPTALMRRTATRPVASPRPPAWSTAERCRLIFWPKYASEPQRCMLLRMRHGQPGTCRDREARGGGDLPMAGGKPIRVRIAISHFWGNRLFSPGFRPAEPQKSAERAGHCWDRTVKRKSSVRYCRVSHVPFCRSLLTKSSQGAKFSGVIEGAFRPCISSAEKHCRWLPHVIPTSKRP
jgi:hypothetical protein